jgi:tetratricopeptide (TPR) repeat protein
MVVDPGCMKCGDCISVCPEHALYFGFGKPSLFAKARRKLTKVAAPHFSWREELSLLLIFCATLVVFRGFVNVQVGHQIYFAWAESLYGQVPLLLGLGFSVITAFVFVFAFRTVRRSSADFLGLAMKVDGKLSRAGKVFLALTSAWLLFLVDSAVVQYHMFQGLRLLQRDEAMKRLVWWQDPRLAEVAMARGRLDEAATQLEDAIRRRPGAVNSYRDLAHVSLLRADTRRAIDALREAIRIRPHDVDAHAMLVAAYIQAHDLKSAIAEQRVSLESDRSPEARFRLASLLMEDGDVEGAIAELTGIVADAPDFALGRAGLGVALEKVGRKDEAQPHLERAEQLAPGIANQLR